MTETPLFQLQAQSFHYGAHCVLRDISLTIRRGEKVALLGPSGVGKTTLLDGLYRLRPELSALQPQSGGLVELLSAYQNIFMGGLGRIGTAAALWNLLRPLAAERRAIEALAQRLGLEHRLWYSVDKLSGGQRQRVALGRALFRRQPVFLGDEPLSSVDPLQAHQLLSWVLEQHDTAVVSLHNRQLALNFFERVIVLGNGGIIHDGPTRELSQSQLDQFYQQIGSSTSLPSPAAASAGEGWVIRTS
ncbi:MAG: ATP-binding cassette domain-containing protein [Pseudomonadota bacterium]|nr:ATP-binding cassette domain-containing protein [Pseudomonadota bacterium]